MSKLFDDFFDGTHPSSRQTTEQSRHGCCDNYHHDPQNARVFPNHGIHMIMRQSVRLDSVRFASCTFLINAALPTQRSMESEMQTLS